MTDLKNNSENILVPKFNIGIYLPKINPELINYLKKIEDVNFFIIDKESEYPTDELFLKYEKILNLVITNDIFFIKKSNLHRIKVFALLDDDLVSQNAYIKVFKPYDNKWERAFVKIKSEIEKMKYALSERQGFKLVESLKNDNIPKLKLELEILNFLHLKTLDTKFLIQKVKVLRELLTYFPDNIKYNLALAANLGFGTEEKSEAIAIYEKFLPKLNKPDDLAYYAFLQFSLQNFDKFYEYIIPQAEKNNEECCKPFNKTAFENQKNTSDKTLAIFCDKGFGDTLLACKFFGEFKKYFKNVVCVVQEPLSELLKYNFKSLEIVTKNPDINFDYGISFMGIMSRKDILNPFLKNDNESFLLRADEQKIKEFQKYFSSNKFNIGIFWDSSKDKTWKRHTDLKTFLPLAKLNNVQLYSLHIDKEDFELNLSDEGVNIVNLGKHFKTFSDTAAAVENCDLIISTDSSVLNLAGAMGKKTFGLFNQFADWQWYKLEGDNVGWYKSVKPFHAKTQDVFAPEINKMIIEIKELGENKFQKQN